MVESVDPSASLVSKLLGCNFSRIGTIWTLLWYKQKS